MWRWMFILLLLCNALMFFWYAQQQPSTPKQSVKSLPNVPPVVIVEVFEK